MSHPEPINSMVQPRYAGLATFMRLPHVTDPRALDLAIVGVPFDTSTGYRAGARLAPRAIRSCSSQVRIHHPTHGVTIHERIRVADYGDVPTDPFDIARTYDLITGEVDRIYAAGCKVIAVGGDNGITYPILKAVAKHQGPVALVCLDAHTDASDTQFGHKLSHATPFRRAQEDGLLAAGKTVFVGLRGSLYRSDHLDFPKRHFRLITADEVHRGPIDEVVAQVRATVGDAPVYLCFDIDALDPAFAPGTGVPEIGGLTTWQVLQIIRGLVGTRLIGADLVEVSPPCDTSDLTSITAGQMLFEMAAVFAANAPPR